MSLPQSMPSLFGRFTAVLKEHDHLGITLRELKALCSALEKGQPDLPRELEPRRLLAALSTELAGHFAAEESEAYFGTVVAEEPQLVVEIDALKMEHVSMLGAVDVLVELAADAGRWTGLPAPTRRLIAQLERHEGSESKLLRKFFFSRA
jgi:hypothetical protein